MSTLRKPQPEEEEKTAKPRVVPGGSKSDIARAKELIEKHGLQRLLHTKR